MVDFSKQFAVIAKLKSLVKISKNFRHFSESQISETVAKKIQKSSYEQNHQTLGNSNTPPYLELVLQLQSDNDQIFKAAVFNLSNIAINRKKYETPILAVLEKILEEEKHSKEQLEYVRSKIMQIKQI